MRERLHIGKSSVCLGIHYVHCRYALSRFVFWLSRFLFCGSCALVGDCSASDPSTEARPFSFIPRIHCLYCLIRLSMSLLLSPSLCLPVSRSLCVYVSLTLSRFSSLSRSFSLVIYLSLARSSSLSRSLAASLPPAPPRTPA